MYIKQVVLSDFKSYGLRTVVDPFSPKINVVVGANGSGKSNFFHAICFVLSDVRGTLRPADRQKLLHEGAGETQLEAWVELLFDNSDGRFPSDKSEVRLRRTIGQKKDEFRLDNKTVTKSEVQDLLEAAGFSRSNPYNIVQQGKIAQMSLMKDSERLELLKEIAGTKVYEDRRRESLRELMQMDGKRAVISEQINCLEQRMAELEEERQELAAFQEQDRERRAVEFAIYDRELTDTKKKLEEVDRKQSKVRERTGSGQQQMEELRAQLEAAEARAKGAQHSVQGLEREKVLAQDRHAADLQAAMQAEGDLRDLQTLLQTNATAKEDVETERKVLAAQVQVKQAEQEGVGKQLAAAEERQSKLEQSIAEREQKIQALYRKEGRSSRFKSAAERDRWVQEEIVQLRVARGEKDAAAERLRGDLGELKDRIDELSLQITQMEAKGRQAQQEAAGGDRKRAELRLLRDKLQNERQQLFREEADLQRAIGDADEDLKAAQRQLESSTPRDVNVARRAIRGMVEKQKLEGVRGTLMELFDCREMLYTAVEVIAGGQLMNVVVDTQDVALQLHRELHRSKSGRVTFMPLDTIQAEIRDDYPKQWGQDVVPLIQFLEYPADLGHVMRKVFGRALVCRNMEVACQAAASQSEFDCVTLDGDQIERRGAMSGGYTEARMLKLPNCKRIKKLVESKLEKERRLAAAQERLQELDSQLLRLQEQIEQHGGNASRVQEATAQHKVQTSLLQDEMKTARTALTAKEALLKKAENAARDLARQAESLQAELGTPLLANLSASERAQLDDLGQTLEELRQEHLQAKAAALEVQAQHQQLDSLLSGNMRKRLQELECMLEELGQQEDQASLAEHSAALQATKQRQQESEARLQKLEEDLEASTLQVAEHNREQDKLREELLQLERSVQEQESAQENGLRQRAVLLQRRDDLSRKIRDLGSLPADALSSFRKKPSQELKAALHRCNQELKKYSHVNKKALDQWTEFRDSHAAVCNRNAELNQADKRIRELIDMLDMRKDEQIERTFKQVAKAFKEIFARLVRGGWGELVMLKRVAGATETPEDDAEKGPNDVLEKYAGVKVKVSFGGGEAMTLKQLSGGQKTLVALVLIFAIQRCDPAPFYLFDEIDAALDPQYCVSVASMLKAQADNESSPQQFIVTTFRHQLVEAGDKVYGVSHANRTSTIDVISRATATEFLQLEADRERQLPEDEDP